MRVNVKSLTGDEYIIDVPLDNRVSEMKESIRDKSAGLVPIVRQKLVFKGRTMRDGALLSDYNLYDNCKVHLILQKDKNQSSASCLQSSSTGTTNSTSTSTNTPSNNKVGSLTRQSSKSSDHQNQGSRSSSFELKSKFEQILRERLVKLFPRAAVEKIMANLENEINKDSKYNTASSIDDLELMAKEKLNIREE